MMWLELRDWRVVVVRYPLATAFALSLVIHSCLFGFYRVGNQYGWWKHQATWLLQLNKKKKPLSVALPKVQNTVAARKREIPMTFIEVDPSTASKEKPADAKFYGLANTKAANPDTKLDTIDPKLDGSQDKIPRLENVPKPKPFPLQPAIAPDKTQDDQEQEAKAKETPGDLAKAFIKPENSPLTIGNGENPVTKRARTIEEAKAQKNLAGDKTLQDRGVKTHGRVALLDVRVTEFSSYDAAFVAAVQQRWYDLLESHQFTQQSGKVVLEFRLHSDGRISDMKVDGNEVGEILGWLCQRAILDPSPYAKWPGDMLRSIGTNYREVMFTFYYN